MNQKMQQCTTWHPLGIQGEMAQVGPTAVSLAAPSVTFLKLDPSKRCGFRCKTRVINF
jgi:hypothetical protein